MTTLRGASVLVTGGTGSFGQTMVRRLIAEGAREIRVLSRDEQKQDAMRLAFPDAPIRYILGSVTDAETVDNAMAGADCLFHAAAYKIVPSCEAQPMPAVQTNVLGSHVVAQAAVRHGVRGVFLSTDKAVEPVNAMGMTKALMERIVQAANGNLLVTRYGNVMGSRGSVIPLFAQQLAAGQPLTITNPAMTRFLMSLDDAVDLVVAALTGECEPGSVLVHRAPAATVGRIARAMIELAGGGGYRYVGVRPGEKMHETLVTAEEMARARFHGDYLEVTRTPASAESRLPLTSENARQLTDDELLTLLAPYVHK